jgi:hypothetical protein
VGVGHEALHAAEHPGYTITNTVGSGGSGSSGGSGGSGGGSGGGGGGGGGGGDEVLRLRTQVNTLWVKARHEAGESFRPTTRPTLNLPRLLHASV